LQVQHREKYGADAAGGIRDGEEVGEVEAADHRETLWFGSLLHGHQHTKSLNAARHNLGYSRCRPQRPFAEAVMRIYGAGVRFSAAL
jgi:hypothetical protein